jgi:PEP-CTERM motif
MRKSAWVYVVGGAVTLFFAAQAAMAGTVVLTFSGLGNEEPVGNYYNGGFGGNGSGPGPKYGITFESNALAITSEANGGSGNFDGEPTCCNILFFLNGTGDVMNVSAGFKTGFSFYYSAPLYAGSVTVWSGPDATGTELASITLPLTPDGTTYGPPCSSLYDYCPWKPIGVSFSGTAESVNFSGTANYIGFANITLGSATPTPTVPEPASLLLIGAGLAGLAMKLHRRRQWHS